MKPITVVDARMGRGKTTAAIRYMNERMGTHRFLFVTPYLTEVERICSQCGFSQPTDSTIAKSIELKRMLRHGRNISTTHVLFSMLDQEALDLIQDNHYTLVVDESLNIVEDIKISVKDFEIIAEQLTTADADGWLSWNDPEYEGRFSDYKELADTGRLAILDAAMISIISPKIFKAFDEIIMMTYLFDGQYQKAYFDYFGFEYRVVGIEYDSAGPYFSDSPDCPPPLDLRGLLNIVSNPKMNKIGETKGSLSKSWYAKRGKNNEDMAELRRNMYNFFQKITGNTQEYRIWTCFKSHKDKLIPSTGRFRNNFLPMNVRATNDYRQATDVFYPINRFCDPNLVKFFAAKGYVIDHGEFALSEMLQFIWRSAIRDNQPINLYIPSKRMRKLLTDWIDQVSQGGN